MQKSLAVRAPFRFDDVAVSEQPFPHFEADNFLDSTTADALLTWFEQKVRWQEHKLTGYVGYSDIALYPEDLPRELDVLLLPETFSSLRSEMAKFFDIETEGYVRVTAHRLLPGASLRPHTDLAPLRFTHRLIVQLNRGWAEENGGLLCFADHEPSMSEHETPKQILPVHRSALAFEVSERSFHWVTRVMKGERYTLSYAFYPAT
jgi:Rps23 Pro-64 3,4-dihydroxylase Tpa1-like proline 4-hydroxylase